LPWAAAYGARVFTDTWVSRVLIRNGRAAGVEALVRDPNTGALVSEMHVDAQVVVVAGGAIQTPVLLQRSQVPDYSGQLGKNLACQPFTQVLGTFPEEMRGFRGALVGVVVDEFFDSDGYLFMSGLAEPEQLMVQGSQLAGKDHIDYMLSYDHMAGLNAFVIDSGHGSVTWSGGLDEGKKEIHWNPSREEFANIKRATALAARLMFAGGAKRVYLPTFQPLFCDSVFQLDQTLEKVDYGINGLYSFRINAFSPQGTCRMALDRADGVTSEDGEVHDVPGLFVADASLFPEPMPAAPQWSVQVFAKHVAERILARKKSLFIES
jgi:choline dehydrogenase-like flavoprotein